MSVSLERSVPFCCRQHRQRAEPPSFRVCPPPSLKHGPCSYYIYIYIYTHVCIHMCIYIDLKHMICNNILICIHTHVVFMCNIYIYIYILNIYGA